MKITYSVYRHIKGKTESQNGTLNLPEYTPSDWPKVSVRTKIRDIIKKKHPRWIIAGYGIDHKTPRSPQNPGGKGL